MSCPRICTHCKSLGRTCLSQLGAQRQAVLPEPLPKPAAPKAESVLTMRNLLIVAAIAAATVAYRHWPAATPKFEPPIRVQVEIDDTRCTHRGCVSIERRY